MNKRAAAWPVAKGMLPFAVAVFSTAWYFRDTFRGKLPGDIQDGRWTVAIHEHWFQVFRHGRAMRDIGFYFPVHDSLGMSDAFLGQGIVHSIARESGAGAVRAWVISQVLCFLVGALGIAALSRRILRTSVSQVVFVACSCLSYPLVIQQGHVQLFAMLWLSWIAVAAIDVCRVGRAPSWAVPVLLVLPPALALSSWYPFALGSVYAGLFIAMFVIVAGRAGVAVFAQGMREVLAALRRPEGLVSLATSLALWILAAWIYLPAQDVLPARQWSEVALYSPRLSDLINAADRGGGVWRSLYAHLYPKPGMYNGEQPLGVTPILMVLSVLAGFALLRAVVRDGTSGGRAAMAGPPPDARAPRSVDVRTVAFAAFVAVLATWATIVVDERGISLWRAFFEFVPAMNSIRAPFRVEILIYPVLVFVVLVALETMSRSPRSDERGRRRLHHPAVGASLAMLVGVGFLVEMSRPSFSRWTSRDLLPDQLWEQADVVRARCEVFTLAYEGGLESRSAGPGNIDGVILSMVTGVPTIDGHSTASPIGHASGPPRARSAPRPSRGSDRMGSTATCASSAPAVWCR